MKIIFGKSARAVTFIAALLAWTAFGDAAARATDARRAPDVTVARADGTAMHLADLRGRVVLVVFWASWCTPCKTSFPALDALYRELQPRGFEVLAINLDERRADADAFLAARPHVMPVAFDPRGAAPLAFKVRGMPTSVLIDRAGNIRYTHTGYSAKVVDEYRQEIRLLLEERQP
jgi:cytochrome c biogenesis protein CcmG/thiol:disulfide interchange protein DsbE